MVLAWLGGKLELGELVIVEHERQRLPRSTVEAERPTPKRQRKRARLTERKTKLGLPAVGPHEADTVPCRLVAGEAGDEKLARLFPAEVDNRGLGNRLRLGEKSDEVVAYAFFSAARTKSDP